ncbi:MAG: murein biosynthesis integral membrane protein MurJ [Thermodesulfobacteriota bacterium]
MQEASADTGRITRSAGVVGIAVLASRLLGLVREQVFASLFGAGYAYDAFVVAFRIPNLLRDLFAEGALSSAFVTVFADSSRNRGEAATWRLANNVLVAVALLLVLITGLGMLAARPLVLALAPDFAAVADKVSLTSRLARIMMPFLISISLAAVVMGILNSRGRFFVPALASSFFNLGSVLVGVGCAALMPALGQPAIAGMAVGTLAGGLLQLGVQLPSLARCGFPWQPLLDLADPGLRRVFRLMLPAVVGLSATQLNIFINTNFAASCAEGSVSWLNYAFRLVQFPIGLFGVALAVATLPVVAHHAAARDFASLKSSLVSSLTVGLCLTVPATVGLMTLAEPVVRVIFQHGAFTAADTAMTTQALRLYCLGLFAYAAVKTIVPVFYALDDTRFPVLGSFLAVAANITINLVLIERLQHRSVALATSGAMTLNCLFLCLVLTRKLGGLGWGYLGRGLAKIATAAGLMAGWLAVAFSWWGPAAGQGLLAEILFLILAIASAGLVYGVTLYLLGLAELTLLADRLRARLGRRAL